jgi:hypothetical protein
LADSVAEVPKGTAAEDQDNIISLEANVPTAPSGGSGKLVFEDKNGKTPDAVVVKAIARASAWFEQLTTGKSSSMTKIAVLENITDNYVSNLIHLAWLSPDLVDRILDGDQEATALGRGAMLTRKSDVLWRSRYPENAGCGFRDPCYGSGKRMTALRQRRPLPSESAFLPKPT